MADGVIFLPSYYEAIKELSDAERLQIFEAIVRYGLYGEVIDLSPIPKAMFALIKPNIDASKNRYRAAKVNGSKGGRPKNQTENQKQNQRSNQDIDKDKDFDKDSDSDNDTEIEKEYEGRKEPTLTITEALEQRKITEDEAVSLRLQGEKYVRFTRP